ncbi:MAG TPA: selenium metabolism-associated LysR family transcriptional regulator [Acidobacteriota bacterium]|nr:selenium metabolism-associated LysR family transcriptional regulator [Acidobacteriota bacterium]
MELKYIEIFCAVIELKSFSRAARALGLTQPTISIHIKGLEEEFSTRLLNRLGRSVAPTQEGEILYRYAKEIMHLKEKARDAMERLNSGMSGRIVIGASTIPGEYLLPGYLAKFIKLYPEVVPTLRIGDSGVICDSVLKGDVDVGIIGSRVKDRNIEARKFHGDELILVAPPDFRQPALQKSELGRIPLIMREPGSGSRATLEACLRESGLQIDALNLVAEIGSSQALIKAVQSGLGLAFISRLSVSEQIGRGALKAIPVKGIRITRNFSVITHRLRFSSHICKTFIEFLASPAHGDQDPADI